MICSRTHLFPLVNIPCRITARISEFRDISSQYISMKFGEIETYELKNRLNPAFCPQNIQELVMKNGFLLKVVSKINRATVVENATITDLSTGNKYHERHFIIQEYLLPTSNDPIKMRLLENEYAKRSTVDGIFLPYLYKQGQKKNIPLDIGIDPLGYNVYKD